MIDRCNVLSIAFTKVGVGTTLRVPEYLEITEGRKDWLDDKGAKRHYGWCGDFATYCCHRAGARGSQLNRVEVNGKWEVGKNLAMLRYWAEKNGQWFVPQKGNESAPDVRGLGCPGDLIIFYRPDGDHIAVIAQPYPLWTIDGNSNGGLVCFNKRGVDAKLSMPIVGVIRVSMMP